MLFEILVTLFVLLCFFLIFIILLQKGKSSMGLGNLGGSTQMLFGGSGGQDLFQKVTWVLGAIFMGGSLLLAMMKKQTSSELLRNLSRTETTQQATPVTPKPASTDTQAQA